MATIDVAANIAPHKARAEPIKSVKVSSLFIDCLNGFCIISIPENATKTAVQSKIVIFSFKKWLAKSAVNTGLV